MKINLHIEADTPEEVKKAIGELAGALSAATTNSTPSEKSGASKQTKSTPAKSTAAATTTATSEPTSESNPESTPTSEPEANPTSANLETPPVSLEEVRAKLASLSQSGKQAQVKELITKFGASKLTDIPAEKYSELLEEAGKIA